MTETTLAIATDIEARFPEGVTPDERQGYEGYLVEAG